MLSFFLFTLKGLTLSTNMALVRNCPCIGKIRTLCPLFTFIRVPDTPEKQRKRIERLLAHEIPFEHRRVDGMRVHFREVPSEPRVLTWVKANGYIGKETPC